MSTLDTEVQRRARRRRYRDEFLAEWRNRHPDRSASLEQRISSRIAALTSDRLALEGVSMDAADAAGLRDIVLETIVDEERPVFFVQDDWINSDEVTIIGEEARELGDALHSAKARLQPLMPLIGRIDVTNFPGIDFVGTGWLVAEDIVVTNRHVANLIARWDGRRYAFSRGIAGRPIAGSLCTAREFDDSTVDAARLFSITEVLFIERDDSPYDIAFLRIKRRAIGTQPTRLVVSRENPSSSTQVVVVGYPARARADLIPDQALMQQLFRDRYDVKRAAPGYTMSMQGSAARHDCTTLGGNSGSVVLDLRTGLAVGLHFAGLYREANCAVPASVLFDYVDRRRWGFPPQLEVSRPPVPAGPSARGDEGGQAVSVVTIPITIQLTVGHPVAATASTSPPSLQDAEAAALEFWDHRPEGVIAVRVGFDELSGTIGDQPFVAASVPAGRLDTVATVGPGSVRGVPIRYLPATVEEQVDAEVVLEAALSISYDDEARTTPAFTLAPVDEDMTILAHVGPEYSWDVLQDFMAGAARSIVVGMYEFHGDAIRLALESRLDAGVRLLQVLDNLTFTEVDDPDEEFDRDAVFNDWQARFGARFSYIVAPEGAQGLIANAYHIKVMVVDDDRFWLSSGNWKTTSSQPAVTEADRQRVPQRDLKGNREWHVCVENPTLALRLRNHINQDLVRSRELGAEQEAVRSALGGLLVDVVEEVPSEERPPPRRVLEPLEVRRRVRVRPLLTPDRQGAVYTDAVINLIQSAEESLLFQIPYIGMPTSPRSRRGHIDALIKALVGKLKSLPDARVLLRSGSSRFSAPAHSAWYFKSKGVDIGTRLRVIDDHHTKGMVVDGKRVLIGSHNWSQSGVSLNRDASLIFDDEAIALYFAEAFEIDWARAGIVQPRRYVAEGVLGTEATYETSTVAYARLSVAEVLRGD